MRRVAAFLVASLSAGAAGADPVAWVDWQSADSLSVYGIALVDGATVAVTYTGERGFVQTSCGTDYWTAPGATNPYISPTVDNPPNLDQDPARRCDIIALNLATQKSMTFSEQVTNPLFAVVSLNGNGYRFDRDFDILSFARGYWGDGTLTKRITTNPDGSVTYDLIGTGEPHGVIQFIGTFSSVTWDSLTNEYWNGFSVAVENLAVNVPPEIEVSVDGVALSAGQPAPVVLGPILPGTSTTATITIANTGTGPLNLAQVSLTGPEAGDFALGPFPPAVAAGAETHVRLTFTPGLAAVSTASVSIVSDDADEGVFAFTVRGVVFVDGDGDTVPDGTDNCPLVANPDQADLDGDGVGNACDDDVDGDGTPAVTDCDDRNPALATPLTGYVDEDGDGRGVPPAETFCADACDEDLEGCPDGFTCFDISQGEGQYSCVPPGATCLPPQTGLGTSCFGDNTGCILGLEHCEGDAFALGYCTRGCDAAAPCPAGYACLPGDDGVDVCRATQVAPAELCARTGDPAEAPCAVDGDCAGTPGAVCVRSEPRLPGVCAVRCDNSACGAGFECAETLRGPACLSARCACHGLPVAAGTRDLLQEVLTSVGSSRCGAIFDIFDWAPNPGDIVFDPYRLSWYDAAHNAPLSGLEVMKAMVADLDAWVREQEAAGADPRVLAAEVHHRLVSIHPFMDGNGRTSKLMADFMMARAGAPEPLWRESDVLRQVDRWAEAADAGMHFHLDVVLRHWRAAMASGGPS
ncbi:MAG: choice-of-anchor D domain-containing protein [Myxococcales bacterium]|nr:choice-of-anchor D domain-containing protein [Myxococcales bacterium]